ncbi:MAG: hypothetical protein KDJ34_08050 [Candidatus Competibacteraceae bacterium]|nr:hypothetical protein [Candidatus Competibacteraceae bacterium]
MSLDSIPEVLKPLIEEAFAFRETLSPESDRGCALMAAAFLDSRLATLIRKKLINEPNTVQQFLEFNGVAGTFSSRIDFCFLTGLIPRSVQSDLHLIRKIRNEFGHRAEPITFENQEIRSRCELFQNMNALEDARPRLKFTNTCFGVLSVIDVAIITAKEFESPSDYVLTPKQKKQSREGILAKFNEALDKLDPEKFGTTEGKEKIVAEVIGSILKQGASTEIEQADAGNQPTAGVSDP